MDPHLISFVKGNLAPGILDALLGNGLQFVFFSLVHKLLDVFPFLKFDWAFGIASFFVGCVAMPATMFHICCCLTKAFA
ncbi:MAG: hypothetical protein AAF417_22765, partial [Pseudomonadota bacterium]